MITTVAWLRWYLRSLMSCLFSYVFSQRCSQSSKSVMIGVFLSVYMFGDTPSLNLGRPFSPSSCVCLPASFSNSLSLTRSFLSLSTSPLYVCLFPPPPPSFFCPFSSHRGCMHSCQEGRRCLWSGLDKDQTSPPRYPPSCSPLSSPPPWENGCTLLPGRAPAPLWVCCHGWQQRLNMICLSAAVCLHQALAPTSITPVRDPEGWLAGADQKRGRQRLDVEG